MHTRIPSTYRRLILDPSCTCTLINIRSDPCRCFVFRGPTFWHLTLLYPPAPSCTLLHPPELSRALLQTAANSCSLLHPPAPCGTILHSSARCCTLRYDPSPSYTLPPPNVPLCTLLYPSAHSCIFQHRPTPFSCHRTLIHPPAPSSTLVHPPVHSRTPLYLPASSWKLSHPAPCCTRLQPLHDPAR